MIDEIRFAGNHGRWIKKRMFSSKKDIKVDDSRVVCCSYCETLFKIKWAESEYCPVCGAIMDETGTAKLTGDYEGGIEVYQCSLCGYRFNNASCEHWIKCPDCGADLERK